MSDLLIDAQSLQQVLTDPDWLVFDVRYTLSDPYAGEQMYLQGHVPGAFFLDQGRHLAGHSTGLNGRHPLPDRRMLRQLLQDHGVTAGSNIVVYDHNDGSFAARAWWLLRWLGCTKVRVLDGGLQAWRQAGGSLQTGPVVQPAPVRDPASLDQSGDRQTMPTVTADELRGHLSDKSRLLIDARSPERYRGEAEPIDPVAGRIPGALNRPIASNVQADGRFKPASRLREEFNTLLDDRPVDQVVHYCGSGITACHNIFAMELAGFSAAALYPGSWSEWCSDRQRPVATG